ncbi:MAG: response regulator [Gammaproteobacteria bacterium]|nr:response regulator [Gammaproteobacteria bacterium]
MKILVAEDTENSRIFLCDYLEGMGYEVISAENGKLALDLLQSNPVDLVISDILMPELDGFELCQQIKSNPTTSNIAVIFYTATYTEEQDKQLGLSFGASRYLVKPHEPDMLLKEIEAVLYENRIPGSSPTPATELENAYRKVISNKLSKKLAELEKEKAESDRLTHQIETINDALPSLISHLDKDFKYVYVNAAYERWHKLSKEKIVGQHIADIIGNKGFAAIESQLEATLRGEKIFFETEIRFKNNEFRYIQAQYMPNYNKDKQVVGIFAIVTDLTEKYLAEQERTKMQQQLQQGQKLELIGQLTGGIAHDFNNILTVISGFTSLSLLHTRQTHDTELEKYLTEIESASDRAKNIVAQLLSFCRGSGQESSIIGVSKAVREIISLLRSTITSKIVIETTLPEGVGPYIKVNPVQLDQVIMNLCINAKDAIENHGIINISIKKNQINQKVCSSCLQEVNGEFVDIEVKDSGEGINQEDITRIFEPFFTTKERDEGTGLGLAMTHGIIHEFNGHIIVDSQKGVGTTIHILLPVASSAKVEEDDESRNFTQQIA